MGRHPREVVIVGNGPGLRGQGLGPVIDEFPEVVRFNDYAIEGHEADIGTRTTVHVMVPKLEIEPRAPRWIWSAPCSSFTTRVASERGGEIVPSHQWRAAKRLVRPCKMVSSGFVMVMWMLRQGYRVTVVGFGGPGWYWRAGKGSRQHNFQAEYRYLRFLEGRGQINFLTSAQISEPLSTGTEPKRQA